MSNTIAPSEPTVGRPAALDDIDRRILEVLVSDARVSIRALAERVHISRTNAHVRVERLVREGVVTGFHAAVVPGHVGLHTSAYVGIAITQHTWREVSAALRKIPYVVHAALISGENDVLALVRTPDNVALKELVLDRIQSIPGVRSTQTWLVFDEWVGEVPPWATRAEGASPSW